MVRVEDLICMPYTPDLTESGISYACQSLPHMYGPAGGSRSGRLLHTVAGISVELAFRRYLTQQQVAFDVKGSTPFTDPDRYDISLGGHRCNIKSFLISYRDQIAALHTDPAQMLRAPALVPVDQNFGADRNPEDLYLFAFLTGLTASSAADIRRAVHAGNPVCFLHALPAAWVRPQAWIPLGPLLLKSECDESLTVEIGGQGADRGFIACRSELPPRRRVQLEGGFHSLSYLRVDSRPTARLGIHSPTRAETYLVPCTAWDNIWIYGMRIYMAGWISWEDFRQRAGVVQEGSRVFQYDRTHTKNLAVPISDLHPLPELISRVRSWMESRGNALR